jgi:cytochrome subunit of sulfide dehydrogenase
MKRIISPLLAGSLLAGVALLASAPAFSQDARYLAANCANCHGTDGKAATGMPVLAGMNAAQFVATMKSFKDGSRPATIMHQISKGYSDEQIAVLASYFSQQK